MIIDVMKRKAASPEWYEKYALGICKYLEESIWLTPLPEKSPEAEPWYAKM
jgi:hypothetical protein